MTLATEKRLISMADWHMIEGGVSSFKDFPLAPDIEAIRAEILAKRNEYRTKPMAENYIRAGLEIALSIIDAKEKKVGE